MQLYMADVTQNIPSMTNANLKLGMTLVTQNILSVIPVTQNILGKTHVNMSTLGMIHVSRTYWIGSIQT